MNNVIWQTQPSVPSSDPHGRMVAALVTSVCLCQPPGAQAATASGRNSQAVVKISKSTECEGHMFFARASEIHFYPFKPKEFFHPLKISMAFLCDYCTGDCFILFPNSDFSIVSYLI